MEYLPLQTITGVVRDYNRRIIPDDKYADCLNVMFKEGRAFRRFGNSLLGAGLTDPILGMVFYSRLRDTTSMLVACTRRHVYYWNTAVSPNAWTWITRSYTTGTVSCSGTAVTGVGSLWIDAPQNFAHYGGCADIKFFSGSGGSQDVYAAGTPDTWYTIKTFDTNTTLTLDSAGPTVTGKNYVIRLHFTGTGDDIPSFTQAIDGSGGGTGESLLVITNYYDPPLKFTGDPYTAGSLNGLCRVLQTSSPTLYGKYATYAANRTVFGYCNDVGGDYPQDVYWSAVNNPFDWSSGEYVSFTNTRYPIRALIPLGGSIFVFKDTTISELYPSGNTDVFGANEDKVAKGTMFGRSVINIGDRIIFLSDDNLYEFDGNGLNPIGEEVINEIIASQRVDKSVYVHAMHVRPENLYVLFVCQQEDYPDKAYVWNYKERHWSIWVFPYLVTCSAIYWSSQQITWANFLSLDPLIPDGTSTFTYDAEGNPTGSLDGPTWDDIQWTWSDSSIESGAPIIVIGDSDGNVYELRGTMTTDNGANITCSVETKDYRLGDSIGAKKIYEVVLAAEYADNNYNRITISPNSGMTWSDPVDVELVDGSNIDLVEERCNFNEYGKMVRVKITNLDGGEMSIESIAIGYSSAGRPLTG